MTINNNMTIGPLMALTNSWVCRVSAVRDIPIANDCKHTLLGTYVLRMRPYMFALFAQGDVRDCGGKKFPTGVNVYGFSTWSECSNFRIDLWERMRGKIQYDYNNQEIINAFNVMYMHECSDFYNRMNDIEKEFFVVPDVLPVTPVALSDDGTRTFLAADTVLNRPYVYALTVPYDLRKGGTLPTPQNELYEFGNLHQRDVFLGTLRHLIWYQHTFPAIRDAANGAYHDKIMDFYGYINTMSQENYHAKRR